MESKENNLYRRITLILIACAILGFLALYYTHYPPIRIVLYIILLGIVMFNKGYSWFSIIIAGLFWFLDTRISNVNSVDPTSRLNLFWIVLYILLGFKIGIYIVDHINLILIRSKPK
jgi:hypothetical protein